MGKTLVGSVGRGEATVFGGTTNPIAIYMQTQAARQRQQQQQQAAQEKQIQESLDYVDKIGAKSKFEEMNMGLAMKAKKFSDYFRQSRREGKSLDILIGEARNFQRELEAEAGEMNVWRSEIDTKDKEIDDLMAKGILWSGADNPIGTNAKWETRKKWRNPDGSIKDPSEIRGFIHNIDKALDDPRYIDPRGATKNWMSTLKDQTYYDYEKSIGGIPGYSPDDIKYTIESKLKYKIDPKDGRALELDEEGNPIPIINDYVLNQAKKDPWMNRLIKAYGGPDQQSQIEYLKTLVEPGSDIKKWGDRQITRGQRIPEEDKFYYAYGSGFRTPVADLEQRDRRLEEIVSKNRPDLLAGLSDPSSDLKAFYVNSEGKPLNKGEKPASIVMVHVGRKEVESGQVNPNDLTSILNAMRNSSLDIKPETYPIATSEDKRKAKIAMSLRLDKIDAKRAIGEEYSNFVDAKYKQQLSKNSKTKSGVVWKTP